MKWYVILPIAVVCAAILVILLLLFMSKPSRPRPTMREFKKTKYAHRGLHDEQRAENSLAAFRAAVDAGFGIEFDVRLCKSGELVIFHDAELERVTSVKGKVIDKTLGELRELRLSGTDDTIPTFDEVLDLVNGQVPLLIEIKEDFGEKGVAQKTAERLKTYQGKYIVESFSPLALRKVKKALPDICRGILSANFVSRPATKKYIYALLQRLRFNFLAKPDFIAYEHASFNNFTFRTVKKLFRPATFAWTITSPEEEQAAYAHGFDSVIFEGYLPEK